MLNHSAAAGAPVMKRGRGGILGRREEEEGVGKGKEEEEEEEGEWEKDGQRVAE